MSQHHHTFDRTTFYEGDEVWAPDATSNTIKKAIVIFSDLSAKKATVQFVWESTKVAVSFRDLEPFGR